MNCQFVGTKHKLLQVVQVQGMYCDIFMFDIGNRDSGAGVIYVLYVCVLFLIDDTTTYDIEVGF